MLVKILPDESNAVEKLFFEYNALMDIIKYISTDNSVTKESLAYWQDRLFENKRELEAKKVEVADKYNPDPSKYSMFEYIFPEYSIKYSCAE